MGFEDAIEGITPRGRGENQSISTSFTRENWKFYPEFIQELGEKLRHVGLLVFKCIFQALEVAEFEWDEASAGAAEGEGSSFLLFNRYDPKDVPEGEYVGLGEHKDWGYISVLDVSSSDRNLTYFKRSLY